MGQNSDPSRVEAVDRAMVLLDLLMERGTISVTDAARELGVAASTAHRLLSTMAGRGFVEQGERRLYHPGPRLAPHRHDGNGVRAIVAAMRPRLERLAERVGETVHLVMLSGSDVLFLDGVEGRRYLRVGLRTGSRTPAYATSGGRAILARLGEGATAALHPGGRPPWGTRASPGWAGFLRELDEVRERGYATGGEESEPGLVAVGVCVRTDPALAVTAVVPAVRFGPHDERRIADALLEVCSELDETGPVRP